MHQIKPSVLQRAFTINLSLLLLGIYFRLLSTCCSFIEESITYGYRLVYQVHSTITLPLIAITTVGLNYNNMVILRLTLRFAALNQASAHKAYMSAPVKFWGHFFAIDSNDTSSCNLNFLVNAFRTLQSMWNFNVLVNLSNQYLCIICKSNLSL